MLRAGQKGWRVHVYMPEAAHIQYLVGIGGFGNAEAHLTQSPGGLQRINVETGLIHTLYLLSSFPCFISILLYEWFQESLPN